MIIKEKGTMHPGPDRIFRVGPGREVTVVVSADTLRWPNGIAWDARNRRWVVASYHPIASHLYTMAAGDSALTPLADGPGKLDGVEVLADGRILVTAWADSSVHVYDGSAERPGSAPTRRRLITRIPEPADLGVDTKRNRVAVPSFTGDRVEFWELPR